MPDSLLRFFKIGVNSNSLNGSRVWPAENVLELTRKECSLVPAA